MQDTISSNVCKYPISVFDTRLHDEESDVLLPHCLERGRWSVFVFVMLSHSDFLVCYFTHASSSL